MVKLDFYRVQDLTEVFDRTRQTVIYWRMKGLLPNPSVKANIPLWSFAELKRFYHKEGKSYLKLYSPDLEAYFA